MNADTIQARYDELDRVAARFGKASAASAELNKRITRCVEVLERGGWQGRGADAFFAEMHGTLYPAMQRLVKALDEGRDSTLRVKEILRAAEEEAAALFDAGSVDRGMQKKSSGGLRITEMQHVSNGELFITDPGDGRAIHPSDAKQGAIGDCFFVTSLAVVAEQNPELIKKMVKQNANGTYTVTFYQEQGGFLGIGSEIKPTQITVSPDFPSGERVEKGKASPVDPHIRPNDVADGKQEIWAMVVEKAYAQWKGHGNSAAGYTTLDEGGHTSDVLFALTGQKSSNNSPDHYSLKDLARMEHEGYAVTLSSLSKDDASKKPLYKNGLVANHAYYITDVDEKNGTVTIQNPWGWDDYKKTVPYKDLQDNFRQITVNPLTRR
jgi:WXG100 family type VII secretion target